MPRALRAVAAAALLALAGCATTGGPQAGETYRSLLGANPGLRSLRAEAEVRVSYLNRSVSLPAVVLLQQPDLFRIDLLDPLDRPAVMIYPVEGKLIHYRPALRHAMALSPFTSDCRHVNPGGWVAAVLSDSGAPAAGEEVRVRSLLGQRSLERSWKGELRQHVRYGEREGRPVAEAFTWYCANEPEMRVRIREWRSEGDWRIPERMQISYLKAALEITIQVKKAEGNPPASADRLLPRLEAGTRWENWNALP